MYLIIGVLALFVSFYLFLKSSGSMSIRKLNMISWIFYFEFLLQGFFSALLVVYKVDFHYLILKIGNEDARVLGYFAILYMMIGLPLGMVIASFLFKFNSKYELNNYLNKPIVPLISKADSYLKIPLYFLTILSFAAIVYTFYTIRDFPILKMLSGSDSSSLALLRTEAKSGFSGNTIFRNIFGISLTPILCYIAYCYYFYSKSFSDKFWFYLLLVLSILILTYNLEKAPVIFFILGFVFLRILLLGEIKTKQLLFIGTGAIILILFQYLFLSDSFELASLFNFNSGILGRILLGQSAGVYLTFDTFPIPFDYLGFGSLSENITSFFDLEPVERSSRYLIERYNPAAVDIGSAGVINTFFVAEAFANFGYFGLIVAPIYVGFLIQIMYMFFIKSPKSPIFIGLFAYFSYKGGITGGFNEYIYNPNLFILFTLMLFCYSYGMVLKKSV